MPAAQSDVPVHGNYRDYYFKRPLASDPRLALLASHSSTLFTGKRVLDVGCNEGWITCEIAQTLGARRVIGVDIDSALVERAWHRRRTCFSRQQPPESDLNDDHVSRDANYFPASCEHMFGPLPTSRLPTSDPNIFPHNVSFRAADWPREQIPEDEEGFDVITAFSVSKWIHLNTGDAGLRAFFSRVHSTLRTGGVFVLEPQDRASYQKAARMHEHLRKTLDTIEIHPADFERVLAGVGFGPATRLKSTNQSGQERGGFDRPVDLYVKK